MASRSSFPNLDQPASTQARFPSEKPLYSAEDVQAILSKALELRSTGGYSIQELEEMGAELQISPDLLNAAIADWQHQTRTSASEVKASEKKRGDRRRQWKQFLYGSVLMIAIDVLTAGTLTWAIFPVMGWGASLLMGTCDLPGNPCRRSQPHG